MKRVRRHRIKEEASGTVNPKEHDLAYYIHDRVELMHQVFSVLKPKELKAMAPECVRHISVNDLQELCTEELLGISSKRLCAILDGADPPSDTESSSESSQERLETISLDSISSDDEILSQVSSKKKKHKHHSSKNKSKKRKSRDSGDEDENQDKSRRTGLTVLEILELQARARAIRAQLQKEQAAVASTGRPSESATGNSSDGEVEIKEEAAEVVEISSEDEKPNVQELEEKIAATSKETTSNESNSKTITKKVNDLIITVPKNTSRKIKLKRTINLEKNKAVEADKNILTTSNNATEANIVKANANTLTTVEKQNAKETVNLIEMTSDSVTEKDKGKDKKKKRKKDKQKEKDGSDHDEITLQLSDTEKMDLLEDLEGKQFEKSSETEDSSADSDSEDESVEENKKDKDLHTNKRVLTKASKEKTKVKAIKNNNEVIIKDTDLIEKETIVESTVDKESDSVNVSETSIDKNTSVTDKDIISNNNSTEEVLIENDEIVEMRNQNSVETCDSSVKSNPKIIDESQTGANIIGIEMVTADGEETQRTEENPSDPQKEVERTVEKPEVEVTKTIIEETQTIIENNISDDTNKVDTQTELEIDDATAQSQMDLTITDTKDSETNIDKRSMEEKSEGELSDRDSSEVEASEVAPDVVCISDDEVKGKKKKKKDKKCKKSKKSKKSKDFRESADQNFYTETCDKEVASTKMNQIEVDKSENLDEKDGPSNVKINSLPDTKISNDLNTMNTDIDDDVYEILELSDDSSCYEVEEISISKEPTAEEIEALSAKIDEIDRDRNINIVESEEDKRSDIEDLEHVSWKDRYLKSTKVKKVLNTANILNAIRKKNLDLKKKLQESKVKTNIEKEEDVEEEESASNLEEGSIQQYNTLETCNKYVDPIKDDVTNETECVNEIKDSVTKEMKKDAKQLLKMYKMLLKYNDMTKEKDVSKKKKKKKKSKDKDKGQANVAS